MIVAKEKRESNIAEYLLYMWQVEDIIRACNYDITIINAKKALGITNISKPTKAASKERINLFLSIILMPFFVTSITPSDVI